MQKIELTIEQIQAIVILAVKAGQGFPNREPIGVARSVLSLIGAESEVKSE